MDSKLRCACLAAAFLAGGAASGQTVFFNFDSAPVYSPLPIDVASGGLIAHLSGTGQGFSVQTAGTMGWAPTGLTGHFLSPSSVFAADLLVSFSQNLSAFSILYAPQELACDDSARMRVTAYLNGVSVGTATTTAANPGTWPVQPISIAPSQPFNSIVVHYDARPPTCQDWGPIFFADDMTVTLAATPPCYANCDGSTSTPVLNVLDFSCFLNRFAAGDTYANCDGSTTPPVLNVLDFSCFLNRFAAGCP